MKPAHIAESEPIARCKPVGHELRRHRDGNPNVGDLKLSAGELRRSNPYNGEDLAVESDVLADDARIAAQFALPEAIAEHSDLSEAGCGAIRRAKVAPYREIGFQDLEIITGDQQTSERLWIGAPKGQGRIRVSSQAGETWLRSR